MTLDCILQNFFWQAFVYESGVSNPFFLFFRLFAAWGVICLILALILPPKAGKSRSGGISYSLGLLAVGLVAAGMNFSDRQDHIKRDAAVAAAWAEVKGTNH